MTMAGSAEFTRKTAADRCKVTSDPEWPDQNLNSLPQAERVMRKSRPEPGIRGHKPPGRSWPLPHKRSPVRSAGGHSHCLCQGGGRGGLARTARTAADPMLRSVLSAAVVSVKTHLTAADGPGNAGQVTRGHGATGLTMHRVREGQATSGGRGQRLP